MELEKEKQKINEDEDYVKRKTVALYIRLNMTESEFSKLTYFKISELLFLKTREDLFATFTEEQKTLYDVHMIKLIEHVNFVGYDCLKDLTMR